MGLSATSPAQKLTFLLFTSAEGKESPLPFWGPSQSFGFSLLPLGVRQPEVTKYRHLLISPLWPTFFLNGHFLTGHHCSFQREDSINLISIVSVGYHVTIYIYIYIDTVWNDKIVALEKTTWFHFRSMKTGFLFFVTDHLLVGQLCTNPKSDRSLLSCLKVTQCSTSEIGDAPLYNSCPLSIQVMTTGSSPAPSKCKSGLPRITGTCPGWWKQNFRPWLVFGVVSSEGHIMPPPYLWSRLESQH